MKRFLSLTKGTVNTTRETVTLIRPFCSMLLAMAAAISPAAAQQSQFTINVQMDGISCSTSAGSNTFQALAWNFGASTPAPISGSTLVAGKSQLTTLNIVKGFDACSASLFQSAMSGSSAQDLILTQFDSSNRPIMTVRLTMVVVRAYQLNGSSSGLPAESVSVSFSTIQVTDAVSGTTAGWNVTTQKAN